MVPNGRVEVVSLPGLTPYREAHALQLRFVEERIADARPDTLLFVEHEPVVTRGRGLQWTGIARERHVPLLAQLPPGVECVDVERGGDLTYHGPGQLVVYPIVKLDGRGAFARHDVEGYLRLMEQIVIEELARWGVAAQRNPAATGVWVGMEREVAPLDLTPRKIAPFELTPRKIASMGIAVRKWVTYHGLALNLTTDLSHFKWITPCGFSPEVMTRLVDCEVSAEALSREVWEARIAGALWWRARDAAVESAWGSAADGRIVESV